MTTTTTTNPPPPMDHWFDLVWLKNGGDRSIKFKRVFEGAGDNLLDPKEDPTKKIGGRMWLRPRHFPGSGDLVQFTIDIVKDEMHPFLNGLILSPLGKKKPELTVKLPVWDGSEAMHLQYGILLTTLVDEMHKPDPLEHRLETYYTIGLGGKLALDRLRIVYIEDAVSDGSPMVLAVFTHLAGDLLIPSQNGGGNGPPEP